MRYSKPLYGILGAYIPLSVLVLWAPLPEMVLRFFTAGDFASISFEWRLWCITGFLIAAAASCYAGIMKKSIQGHRAADIRGSIIAAAAAYTVLSLMRTDVPLTERFLPSIDSAASAMASIFVWFSVISLNEISGDLELFESFTARHHGEQLMEIMREFSPEMSRADQSLKRLALIYGIQFIPPCLLMTAAGFSRVPLPFTVFTLIIFCAGFLLLGFLGLLRRELACAAEGLSPTVRGRSLPLPVMGLGICAAAILALVISSDSSLLPPGIILAFFAWLGRLLASLFPPQGAAELPPMTREALPMAEDLRKFFPMDEANGPWPGWKYVKLFFAVLAAFLFLYFMIYPLLRRSRFSIKIKSIAAAVSRWFMDFKKGISVFFLSLRDHRTSLRMKKIDKEKLRRIASELLSGNIKRKEIKRSLNLFARLILWGIETVGVPWRPSLAPGEYCGLLAAAINKSSTRIKSIPDTNRNDEEAGASVIRCGELFEKALYSARPLSEEEEQDFKLIVQSLID